MLSSEMFREFSLPHIADMIEISDYPLFHLDGKGMIDHLDCLLDIPKLKAIQWQPGAGCESLPQWYPLIRKILDAGKAVQLFTYSPEELDDAVKALGTKGLLFYCVNFTAEQAKQTAYTYA